jgi:hypothetical protein
MERNYSEEIMQNRMLIIRMLEEAIDYEIGSRGGVGAVEAMELLLRRLRKRIGYFPTIIKSD